MAECGECGAEVAESAATCDRCGAAVEALRRCPHCQQNVDAGERACPACGHLAVHANCALHPDRTAEGACVMCGREVCEECNQSNDVHYACLVHGEIPVIEGWAQVYTTSDDVEAQLIRENLQAEGIDAEVLSLKDHTLTVDLGELSAVRLLVPAYEYVRARELTDQRKDAEGELIFACSNCGEVYEAGEPSCATCGAPLPHPPS